jgi:hypothetical protein
MAQSESLRSPNARSRGPLFPGTLCPQRVSLEFNPTATYLNDVATIHAIILPLIDAGREIFIVAHSYGGIPGCAATEGQSVRERFERRREVVLWGFFSWLLSVFRRGV